MRELIEELAGLLEQSGKGMYKVGKHIGLGPAYKYWPKGQKTKSGKVAKPRLRHSRAQQKKRSQADTHGDWSQQHLAARSRLARMKLKARARKKAAAGKHESAGGMSGGQLDRHQDRGKRRRSFVKKATHKLSRRAAKHALKHDPHSMSAKGKPHYRGWVS